MLLCHIHCIVSVDRVGRDADRNSCEATVFDVTFFGTGPRRLCIAKLRNIRLNDRLAGLQLWGQTDAHVSIVKPSDALFIQFIEN
jgi:hypothetical protein